MTDDLFSINGVAGPERAPKPPNAGDLVAAWCKAWSAAHEGDKPHPSVVRRVAGICRTVSRDCAELDDWRAAWRAANAAGARGSYDVVGALAAPNAVASGRGNHFLAIARDAAAPPELASGESGSFNLITGS